MQELLACTFTPFWAGFVFARTSCVRVYTFLGRFRVRENFLRARLHRFGQVSRSRELLACAFTPFWTGFAFARTSCVRVYTLLDGFRVRENFLRARLHRFGQVSCSRELLACAFTPFWTGFAFARTSCVRVYTLLDGFRVCEMSSPFNCVKVSTMIFNLNKMNWYSEQELFRIYIEGRA
jgi:hypothetical protein